MVFIIESKCLSSVSFSLIIQIWGIANLDLDVIDAFVLFRGIRCVCNKDVISISYRRRFHSWVLQQCCSFMIKFSSHIGVTRSTITLNEMGKVFSSISNPILLMDNLNQVLCDLKRRSGSFSNLVVRNLKHCAGASPLEVETPSR